MTVAALALFVLVGVGAVVGRALLAVSQGVFDVLLGEQHEELSAMFDIPEPK